MLSCPPEAFANATRCCAITSGSADPAATICSLIAAAGSDDPLLVARHLVAFANASGGQDNIAAALARVGKNADAAPEPVAAHGGETDG